MQLSMKIPLYVIKKSLKFLFSFLILINNSMDPTSSKTAHPDRSSQFPQRVFPDKGPSCFEICACWDFLQVPSGLIKWWHHISIDKSIHKLASKFATVYKLDLTRDDNRYTTKKVCICEPPKVTLLFLRSNTFLRFYRTYNNDTNGWYLARRKKHGK